MTRTLVTHYAVTSEAASIAHAIAEIHVRGKDATVLPYMRINGQEERASFLRQLYDKARAIFSAGRSLLDSLDWQALIKVNNVPSHLDSLLRVMNDVLVTPTVALANAFYAGAVRFMDYMVELADSAHIRAIMDQLVSFGTLVKQYATSAVVTGLRYIVEGVRYLVTHTVSLFTTAVEHLASFSSTFVTSMLAIPSAGSAVMRLLHERCVQTVLFTFMAAQDVFQLGTLKVDQARAFLARYVKEADALTNTVRQLMFALSPTGAVATVLNVLLQNSNVQRLWTYVQETEPYLLVTRALNFLSRILGTVHVTISAYLQHALTRGIATFSDILYRLVPEEDVPLFNLGQACTDMSNVPGVTPANKTKLQQAVKLYKELEHRVANNSKERFKNGRFTFDHALYASSLCSKLYFGHEVTEEELEQVSLDQTGMSFTAISTEVEALRELMLARYVAATPVKQKMAKIDGQDDEDLVAVTRERQRVVAGIDAEIAELRRRIEEIQTDNLAFIEAYDQANARYNAMAAGPNVTLNILETEQLLRNKNVRDIEDNYGITALKEQIARLEQRKATALQSSARIKSTVKWRVTAFVSIVLLGISGVAAYAAYKYHTTSTTLASETIFRPLLRAAGWDPVLGAQVAEFARTRGYGLTESTPEILTEFQRFQQELIYDIKYGTTDAKTAETTYGSLIVGAVRRQLQGQEIGPKEASFVTSVWRLLGAAPNKREAVAAIEAGASTASAAAATAVATVMDQTGLKLLQKVDIDVFRQGHGAYDGKNTQEQLANYALDLSTILRYHAELTTTFIIQEQERLAKVDDTNKGWLAQVGSVMGMAFTMTGVKGVDTTLDTKGISEIVAKGGFAPIAQYVAYYSAYGFAILTAIRTVITIVVYLAYSIAYFLSGEHEEAADWLNSLQKKLIDLGAALGLTLIDATTSIFAGRFALPLLFIKLLMLWFPGGWIMAIVRGTSKAVKYPFAYFLDKKRPGETPEQTAARRDAELLRQYDAAAQKSKVE